MNSADAERLCDRVAELEADMQLPAVVDAADRLYETAAWAARELAAEADKFEDETTAARFAAS
jgi:hypothetical protein